MSLLSEIWKTLVGSRKTNLSRLETNELVNSIPRKKINFYNQSNLDAEYVSHIETEHSRVTFIRPIPRKKSVGRKNTKHNQVKKHLIEKGTIDSWTAIELYGATRLSAIIFNLRVEGHNIDSIPNTSYDRNQELCNFTTYKYINYNGIN